MSVETEVLDGVSERVFAHRDVTANRGPRRVREIVGRVGPVPEKISVEKRSGKGG